jgi:predicted MFS family arabinose efflux permease
MAFFCLAIIGLGALWAVWSWMPETRPAKPLTDNPATVAA